MSAHFIEKCPCGIVVSQCRCAEGLGEKKTVRIVPCQHDATPPAMTDHSLKMRVDDAVRLRARVAELEQAETERIEWVKRAERAERLNDDLREQLATVTAERDAALAEQAVLDAKYVDERAAKDSALAEVEQYYKCLQIEKGEHARALDERDAPM